MKTLTEMLSQEPILEFEGFILRLLDGWNLFLENPIGEGTQIRKQEFLSLLAKLFERNF